MEQVGFVVQPTHSKRTGSKARHHDISPSHKAVHQLPASLSIEVDGDASLVSVAHEEDACACPFQSGGRQLRVSSPESGDSTLMTSAPRSPSSMVPYGPARFPRQIEHGDAT